MKALMKYLKIILTFKYRKKTQVAPAAGDQPEGEFEVIFANKSNNCRYYYGVDQLSRL